MAITWRVPVLLLLGLVPVVLFPSGSTVWAWLGITLVLVAVDWWRAPRPQDLSLTRGPSEPVRQGSIGETTVVVTNAGRRSVRGVLRDAWPPSAGATGNRHPLVLPPGGQARLTTTLVPTRRGDRRAARVTVRSLGPWGLAARQAGTVLPGRIRVLPAFPSRRHLPSRLARLHELEGRALVQVRGQGTEFDSLREYVRGDDVRSIDWRASARSRDVVVRTWQPERDRRVVLVLDTGRLSAGRVDDVPRLDAAMDAALLLAALADRAGDRVDLVAGDQAVRARVKGRAGADTPARIQQAMSGLQPALTETSWPALVGAVQQVGRRRSLVVLLTPLEPAAVEEGLLPLLGPLTARHQVLLASVRDPALSRIARTRDGAASTYAAGAAEQALDRRDRVARLLASLGVDVVDEDADSLPPALSDRYLALKARGRL